MTFSCMLAACESLSGEVGTPFSDVKYLTLQLMEPTKKRRMSTAVSLNLHGVFHTWRDC